MLTRTIPVFTLLLFLIFPPGDTSLAAQGDLPGRDAVDVYLLAGQSNMAGRGMPGAVDTTVHPRVFLLDAQGAWMPAREPVHYDKPRLVGVGPGLAFGKAMARAQPGRTILLVPAAVGGTSVNKWFPGAADPATNTHPYDDALDRLRRAESFGTLRGIIWHQGESDANRQNANAYRRRLARVIANFRRDTGTPDLPFVAGELGPYLLYPEKDGTSRKNRFVARINRTVRELGRAVPNYAWIPANGTTDKGDGTHFDAASGRLLGERFAAALLQLRGTAPAAARPPNVLLLCIDDLRPELGAFGADYIHSPNIDRLAAAGRAFTRHYVNAPSCGPSRFTLLTGRYGPSPNDALFQRARAMQGGKDTFPPDIATWFRGQGYRTVSVGKVSHHPGGLGGPDWNDPEDVEMPGAWDLSLMPTDEWQHPRGSMHGLAHGEIRGRERHTMAPMQAAEGGDEIYPDGRITAAALDQLQQLGDAGDTPFFLAVGLIKPHLPFGAPKKYLDLYADAVLPPVQNPDQPDAPSTWHRSGEFRQYRHTADAWTDPAYADSLRRHYAACVSYADAQVGKLLDRLAEYGLAENTIVVLWGDHGWNLGHHAIWGKHNLFEEALHSPLIVRVPGMPRPGVPSEAIVETVDLFPTLCALSGLPVPAFTHGTSFRELVDDPRSTGGVAAGYYRDASTLRTDRYRLIVHPDGAYELYDHREDPLELNNLAEREPRLVQDLERRLRAQLAGRVTTY